ncbi:uncharacterized protein LOC122512319 [Leptopilina heterotoma]|uniref:uncharacterized protein LOC122512319 n=1 Tax=Leptopilina heterotoma TaxID=63436 RepID=UPI001CA8BD4C|nr:uncharacterized protein LOC122512319 [Leptopilina heterotoma]XP_043484030.1 uncharacterized protein LOC122512319 [Leptopilina heterotoma]
MMPTTFISPLKNNHFFSVCHYITTLGIILNNNNLLSTTAENDTIPVLNAFFEYLNKSNNESAAKIHLFKEMRSKINISDFEDPNNLKNVNELYQYIINMGLFAHYGNITGYVRNVFNDNNNGFSNLKEILYHDFSNNLTTKNICSLRKETEKLHFLAIERIFAEYVLPIFTEIWKGKNLNVRRNDLKIVKRFRRQVSSSEDSDIDVVGMDEDPPKVEYPIRNFRLEFLSNLKVNGLTILNQERDLFSKIVTNIALEEIIDYTNNPLDLWLLEITTDANLANSLFDLKGSKFFFNDFKILTKTPSGEVPPKIWKPYTQSDETNVLYHIVSESQEGFVDLHKYNIHNLYIVFPEVDFKVTNTRYVEIENKLFLIINLKRMNLSLDRWYRIINATKHSELSNARDSTRMKAIEKAAKYISSNVPLKRFSKAVTMLKSFILSVGTYNPNLLTYKQLAENYSNGTTITDFYSPWKIDNSKYINDVLYESKFYFQYNSNHYKWNSEINFKSTTKSFLDHYYDRYKADLDIFHKKIRFEDFYRIHWLLVMANFPHVTKHEKVSLLRVALRQCDEELNEEPIVLYQAFYATDTYSNINLYTREHVTLKGNVPCSRNRSLVLSSALNDSTGTGILFFFKIKINNRCGVADVYQFFKNEVKSHFLISNEKYKRIEEFEETIENQKVIFVTVESNDIKSKEEKIINIVNKLNDIYMDGVNYFVEEY